MRSSLSKPILITCDLLLAATLIFALYSADSKATPASSRLYFAASLLCLIACIATWIFGYRHETRRRKTQPPKPGTTPTSQD